MAGTVSGRGPLRGPLDCRPRGTATTRVAATAVKVARTRPLSSPRRPHPPSPSRRSWMWWGSGTRTRMEMAEAVVMCWNQQHITKIAPLLTLVEAPTPMGVATVSPASA
jgi:hypothetical protein